ncbi:MAG: hypothetical protein IKL85_07220, partial [Lentisphaeria bacterium]|nr:hypothetical protein [Lentisphaeria bacterium]
PFDMFRGRIMFPIIDVSGEVVAFGGRIIGDGTPKYLNSSDTPVFNKRRNLYGMQIAKKSRKKESDRRTAGQQGRGISGSPARFHRTCGR